MSGINPDDLKDILKRATQSAREEARKNGVASVYEENGVMVKEYPDGKKTKIIFTPEGRKEVAYHG
ncbi:MULTISPECIES: hypothetical protein [Paenibacillus]|uniref:hypothetical protein n=1 Tax=Paenibacillus TaxID=44249 RepID=UPI00201E5FEB|nr:hypothetical protein [Paenibacillus amylolyticus]MCL6663480.1 hypothetical protein [Paenibacillus amylolyticus]